MFFKSNTNGLRGGFKTKNRSNFGICPTLRWPPAGPPPPSRLRTPLVEKNIFAYLSSTGFETQLVYAGHMQWHGWRSCNGPELWIRPNFWKASLTFIISLSFYYFFNFQICLLLVDLPVDYQQLSCVWYIICNNQLERWPSPTNTLQERSECQQDKYSWTGDINMGQQDYSISHLQTDLINRYKLLFDFT